MGSGVPPPQKIVVRLPSTRAFSIVALPVPRSTAVRVNGDGRARGLGAVGREEVDLPGDERLAGRRDDAGHRHPGVGRRFVASAGGDEPGRADREGRPGDQCQRVDETPSHGEEVTLNRRCPPVPTTLGQLRQSGWRSRTVKDEVRDNTARRIAAGEPIVRGVLGFDDTVLPQLENALLAGHDIVLLGERGQAKTRIIRSLTDLLDEWMPIVAGSEINDDPYAPVSRHARDLIRDQATTRPSTGSTGPTASARSWPRPTPRSRTSSARSTPSRWPRAATCPTS